MTPNGKSTGKDYSIKLANLFFKSCSCRVLYMISLKIDELLYVAIKSFRSKFLILKNSLFELGKLEKKSFLGRVNTAPFQSGRYECLFWLLQHSWGISKKGVGG